MIARKDDAIEAAVLAAAAVGLSAAGRRARTNDVRRRTANTSSHRLNVPCASAEAVLALYARLRAVDGVITIL